MPIFEHIDAKFPDLDWKGYRQLAFTPFDPVRKRTEARIEGGGAQFVAIKGAAQVLLGMAQLPDDKARDIRSRVDALAAKGYRTLAVGIRRGDRITSYNVCYTKLLRPGRWRRCRRSPSSPRRRAGPSR